MSCRIIKRAERLGIRFVYFLPNSTHLCQPLDVAVFHPLKVSWRKVLRTQKLKRKGPYDKSSFPKLLSEAIDTTISMKKNILSGFSATGINPLDRHQVLIRLPQLKSEAEIAGHMNFPVIQFLKQKRFPDESISQRMRKKKVNTPAGRSVMLKDFEDHSEDSETSNSSTDDCDDPDSDNETDGELENEQQQE